MKKRQAKKLLKLFLSGRDFAHKYRISVISKLSVEEINCIVKSCEKIIHKIKKTTANIMAIFAFDIKKNTLSSLIFERQINKDQNQQGQFRAVGFKLKWELTINE